MGLRSTIKGNIETFFRLIGDLGEDIQFTNTTIGGYDFNNNSVQGTATTEVTIRGLVSKQYKDITGNPRLLADIVLKSADVNGVELDGYDTIIFRSKQWSINSLVDNGFVVNLTVAREV